MSQYPESDGAQLMYGFIVFACAVILTLVKADFVLPTFTNLPAIDRQGLVRKDSEDCFQQTRVASARSPADFQQVCLTVIMKRAQEPDPIVGTCSKLTSINRPRSLCLSGLPQNSCQRSSTPENLTGCSSSSATSSEGSTLGSETLHGAEFDWSCQGTGRITPSTRGCCAFSIDCSTQLQTPTCQP